MLTPLSKNVKTIFYKVTKKTENSMIEDTNYYTALV